MSTQQPKALQQAREALMHLADDYAQAAATSNTSEYVAARVALQAAIDAALAQPAAPVRQPLTEAEIAAAVRPLYSSCTAAEMALHGDVHVARAIERALAARWGVTLEGGAA